MPSASFRGRDQLLALHKLKPFTPYLSSILKTQLTFCYLPHQPFPSLLSSITCWIERIKLPFTWFSTGEKVLSLTPRIVHNSSQNSEQPFLIKKSAWVLTWKTSCMLSSNSHSWIHSHLYEWMRTGLPNWSWNWNHSVQSKVKYTIIYAVTQQILKYRNTGQKY